MDCSLVHFSRSVDVTALLFKPSVVEPQVIVVYLVRRKVSFLDFLFKVVPSFGQNSIFHFFSRPILLLEVQKLLVKSGRFFFR